MIISLASDHGGYITKEAISKHLTNQGHTIRDAGCFGEDSCDYPDYGKQACDMVAHGDAEYGILVCGTGIGMSMVANRNPKRPMWQPTLELQTNISFKTMNFLKAKYLRRLR